MTKFRAWDKVAKVMIYHIEQTYDGLGYFQENENIEDYVSDISFGCFSDWLENDQFVIMQFTGLFDTNGAEIFEGDIVVNQYGNVGYIAYLKQEAGFVVVLKKSDYRLGHRNTGESYDVTNNRSIIGNIYQNSDLLESVEE